MNPISLIYTIPRMASVEAALGKKLGAILDEVQSEDGVSLTTLRTLIAHGQRDGLVGMLARMSGGPLPSHASHIPLDWADDLILQHGLSDSAQAVGAALAAFVKTLEKEAA